jgi:hypothetical protein
MSIDQPNAYPIVNIKYLDSDDSIIQVVHYKREREGKCKAKLRWYTNMSIIHKNLCREQYPRKKKREIFTDPVYANFISNSKLYSVFGESFLSRGKKYEAKNDEWWL